jgi:hypothetical protein
MAQAEMSMDESNWPRAIASKLLTSQSFSEVLSVQCGFEALRFKSYAGHFLLLKET